MCIRDSYCLSPPEYSEEELAQLEEVLSDIAYDLRPSDLDSGRLEEYLRERGVEDRLVYLVVSKIRGYDWLQPLVDDERLEDIQCFRAETPLRVVHRDYGLMKTNVVPSESEVDQMVRLLAYRGGSSVSVFRAVEDTVILPTGDRASLTYRSEVSPTSSFTIRKFPRDPWTPTKILAHNTAPPEVLALLWLAVDLKVPVIVYGPMGSGKTSLMNALAMLIKPDASIAIVQDAPEMRVFHENVLYLYERKAVTAGGEAAAVTLEDLIAVSYTHLTLPTN